MFYLEAMFTDADGPGGMPGVVDLAWVDQLCGDYDQNGEVNVGDLSPLGQYWQKAVHYENPDDAGGIAWYPLGGVYDDGGVAAGEAPAPTSGAANWRRARIDGDSNGELNISDLTPIAVHWRECISGYRVYLAPSYSPNDPTWLEDINYPGMPYTVSHLDAQGDAHRPLVHTWQAEMPAGAEWARFWVTPWDNATAQEGIESVRLEVHADGTMALLPVAVLAGNPLSGDPPLDVDWDASASLAVVGTITKYEWDMDHDLSAFDVDSGLDPHLAMTYYTAGAHSMTVCVTNSDGMSGIASATVDVSGGNSNQPPQADFTVDPADGDAPLMVTLDPSGSVDPDGSLLEYRWDFEDDGLTDRTDPAAVMFQHQFDEPGEYTVRLTVVDDQGATGSTTKSIDAHGWVTTPVIEMPCDVAKLDAAVVDGRPALAYSWQSTAGVNGVYYLIAEDQAGALWTNEVQTLYTGTPTGWGGQVALDVIEGHPAVGFIDFDRQVMYCRAADSQGTAWTNPLQQVTAGPADVNLDMCALSDRAAFCFSGAETAQGNMFYIVSTDSTGASWESIVTVASGWLADLFYDMTVVTDGSIPMTFPIISHTEMIFQALLFETAADELGATWGVRQAPIPIKSCYHRPSLAVIAGTPAIAYYGNDASLGNGLYLVTSTLNAGLGTFTWLPPTQLRSASDGIFNCSLAPVGNDVYIAYCEKGWDTQPRLGCARYFDDQGTWTTTWEQVEPDTEVTNGNELILLELNGHPGIAHLQSTATGVAVKFSYRR